MRTKVTTNQEISDHDVIVEFLRQLSYPANRTSIELTTGCGVYNYKLVGDEWVRE